MPEKARESAAANIPANSIHLSINASTPLKEWPLENWAELAGLILKSDPAVQLVATAAANARESARLNRLAAAVPDARLVCLPGLNIGQLAALLQRCRLHLGARFRRAPSGGGPGHFHLHRLPQISRLEGMASARRAATQVSGGGLPVAWRSGRNHCQAAGRAECLAAISAAEVFDAIRTLRPISAKHLKL